MSPQRVAQELLMPGGRINIFARHLAGTGTAIPASAPAIDKGLLGYRMFLVRDADLPRFAVRTLDDLRKLRVGQGKDWIDVPILRKAGFPVVEGTSYPACSPCWMPDASISSRAIDEAQREFKERRAAIRTWRSSRPCCCVSAAAVFLHAAR
jgi:hypothetical protein